MPEAWRAPPWAPPCDHQWAQLCSTVFCILPSTVCAGCAMCRTPCLGSVSCASVGSWLCRVLPNDFLRTQTRGMLLWRSPAPFSHAPSTMSACTKATGCHTGQWNNPNLLPGCPIDCHPATTAVPTLLPNILSAQLDSAPSFTVGSHGK